MCVFTLLRVWEAITEMGGAWVCMGSKRQHDPCDFLVGLQD